MADRHADPTKNTTSPGDSNATNQQLSGGNGTRSTGGGQQRGRAEQQGRAASTSPSPAKIRVRKESVLQPPNNVTLSASAKPEAFHDSWSFYVDASPIDTRPGGASASPAYEILNFTPTQKLSTVKNIEEFWSLWHSIPSPAIQHELMSANKLAPPFTYYFFRNKIAPNWENTKNKNGGEFGIMLWDRDRIGLQDRDVVDDVWQLVMMLLAGESLDNPLDINGVILKCRQRSVWLQLWTSKAKKDQLAKAVASLRAQLVRVLPTGLVEKGMDFYSHNHPDVVKAMKAMNADAAAAAKNSSTTSPSSKGADALPTKKILIRGFKRGADFTL